MKYGFLRVCAATPEIRVADCKFNEASILKSIENAYKNRAKLVVLPELCVTGATLGDLLFQSVLLNASQNALFRIAEKTAKMDIISVIGAPLMVEGGVYNCAAVIHKGEIKAIIPQKNREFEGFALAEEKDEPKKIKLNGQEVLFGTRILVTDENVKNFCLAVEIGNGSLEKNGATVTAKLLASRADITDGDFAYDFNRLQSQYFNTAVICADAGYGESTTDFVLSGKNMIFENGTILAEGKMFVNDAVFAEIDLQALSFLKSKNKNFKKGNFSEVKTNMDITETPLERSFEKMPFVKEDLSYFEKAVSIQTAGVCKRFEHIGAKKAVIGISGGLDSAMALLVAVRAFDRMGLDRKDILAITMPCFGTTKRTYDNAKTISERLRVTFREISIKDAVNQHFKDINQPQDKFDAAFENAQARERTQVLMDIANQIGGIVIGTGDMSELALGWATYNGDHMSMYGVNSGIPKTLIRFLVKYEADRIGDKELQNALSDILDTPVSPELLPSREGKISQKTENAVGPYVLHDFFLYNMLYLGYSPKKIQYVAEKAFKDEFKSAEIEKWLKTFLKRFFSQQFKRSCSPDGVQVLGISLSPRGGLSMPSDAQAKLWFEELEE